MIELGLYAIGAFLIYILFLPLVGAAIGVLIYAGLPYLAGLVMASIAHKVLQGSFFDMGAYCWMFGVLWAVLLVHTRQIFNKALELRHAWFEGHYLAAATILLLGRPYRKRKRAMVS